MDDDGVGAWLASALPGDRIIHRAALTGGHSNDNELLVTARGHRYVLRRYRGANACAKEVALAARLAGVVPVPEVVAADAAAGVLLSRFAEGSPPVLTAGFGRSAGEMLARLGTVTFAAPGFFDGRLQPDGTEPTSALDVWVERCLREGNGRAVLSPDEQRRLLRYSTQAAARLGPLAGARSLVHADYNPKNLLARGDAVVAVLDWEYAYSSSPLFDLGNMLREPRPPGFADAFAAGFAAAGGDLPPDWRELSRALDLYALADLLTRPVAHPYFGRAVEHIRRLR
ncbi:phosphotransferase family protein [Dactylosporangium matsuzakiense]|uniref:Aminoglycoside phosphotransferase domain-containing protein n=1 Tax=Dactylosporangium matsuzakiense TaxID=53360 RepID=A0A9W6KK00_9ACTN|nr:aminoglycoside phosphotransferase family protein [Dactylosporangium matsuzakiense]UWZ41559.1 phosphotransferase [Dactylosporangium matsuzakiense]GLL02377.1 hypothetical protein GCM10017581_041190 [Dactylosporangium matsuzakiense]